ncbi:hypothetical protein KBH77_03900 [Patescibacteria group bacterium]|nr:hypothetical protein [Patescibacteria group bacterium]
MNNRIKRQKTLKDFIKETTFLPDSTKDQDYFFSAYDRSRPYSESLDDLYKLIRDIYDNNKKPNDLFWDFTTNLFHTYMELDKHIALKIYSIEKYLDQDPPLSVILELESSLSPIYYTGSKCARYLLNNFESSLTRNEKKFLNKYKGTRNKIFEHNLNPLEYPFVVRVFHMSVFSTDSELVVELIDYKNKKMESGFIDYYDDNYRLIDICIKYLKSINT